MRKVIRICYAVYAALIFVVLFLIMLPLFLIPILFPSRHRMVGQINRFWAVIYFPLLFIPYKTEYRFQPQPDHQYIFCPNHFSYLDIATMGLNRVNTIFVGKSDMVRIPLFGWMYRSLHITVDRSSLKSRYLTLLRSRQAIDEGKNLVIFPEGGIMTDSPPAMSSFKDGAFRTAVEKQVEIVPVTIPFNWIILPDSTFLPKRRLMKVIFHEPIPTAGLTLEDIPALKKRTKKIIDNELQLQLYGGKVLTPQQI